MITIPTISELYTSIKASIEAEMTISIPVIGPAFIRAVAAVQAGKLWLLYKALGKVQKNIFVDTADPESMGGTLERFGRVKLDRSPFAAIAGEYQVQVTCTASVTLPANTTFKSDDTSSNPGYLFITDNEYSLISGTNNIVVRALTAGTDSELAVSDTMTVTGPVANMNDIGTVNSINTEPQAEEDIEDYRDKAIQAYRLEPQGGAGADYRDWSSEVQGVQTAYPYVVAGNSNQINLYVEATEADSTDGFGTPTAAILAGVESSIEDSTADRPSRKPIGVFQINYLPVVVLPVDITIDGFIGYTAAKGALIETAITNAIAATRPYIGSIEPLADKNDIFDTNKIISKILEAVPGSVFGTITLQVNSVTVTTYTFDNGEIPYLGTISYT